MKRRILLLMMTALLSVGAWAENLWTKAEAIEPGDDTKVQFPADLKTSDVIRVTVTITNENWYHINLYDMTGWWKDDNKLLSSVTMDNNGNLSEAEHIIEIPVTSTIIDAIANSTHYQWLHFYGDGFKMSSVDIARYACGYTLLENADIGYWGKALDCRLFKEYATTNDVIVVTGTKNEEYNGNVIIQNIANNSGYVSYGEGDLGTQGSETPVVIPVTSDMITAASTGLYISGGNYHLTSAKLIKAPSAVSISNAGYATFGYPFAVDLSGLGEGQDAYTVTVSGDKAQLTSVKGKKIPANTGIILTGSGNVTIPLTTETTDDVSGNQLLVSDGTKTGDGSSIYVLANGTNGVGFYKLESGDAIAAGKAYLQVTPPSASSFFDIDDGTTGITMVQGEGFMVNGSDIYYDLQGRRVAKPTKGLYIVNGKKVIIK